jgi:uncharacterized membrane protein YuzA (DUF378 family)
LVPERIRGHLAGFLGAIGIYQIGFAGLKIVAAIAKGRPNIQRVVFVLVAAISGLNREPDAAAAPEKV